MVIKRRKTHRAVKQDPWPVSAKRRAELRAQTEKFVLSMQAPLRTYRELKGKIDTTWKKLRKDVKGRSRRAIVKGRRDLLLLLGECNYMAREFKRCLSAKAR